MVSTDLSRDEWFDQRKMRKMYLFLVSAGFSLAFIFAISQFFAGHRSEELLKQLELHMEKGHPNAKPPSILPIGSIIAYGLPLDSDQKMAELQRAGWSLCDGSVITDAESPIKGSTLPKLTDDRFLMGVGLKSGFGLTAGNNKIPQQDHHAHAFSAQTGGGGGLGRSGGDQRNLSENTHTHSVSGTTSPGGQHDHGGDNKPACMGVYFIMRIK